MSDNAVLDKHAAELVQTVGLTIEVRREGNQLFVVLKGYALPEGVAKVTTTDILFMTDTQYPLSAMDMFWADLDVVRPDGSSFENSDSIEQHLGRQWRRFSYHRNGIWNPAGNPLLDHFAFMESRWARRARQ